MDKELTIQDLEAQADALLAAADEMEELLPADTGKSKRKKAEAEAPEKKAPPLDEKVLAGLPAAEQLQKSEKLRDLFAKGKQKGKLDSDEITEVLDELDPLPSAYTLEVSSPGMARPLRRERDFARFAGSCVQLSTTATEGRRKFTGTLLGCEDGKVLLDCDGEQVAIALTDIKKCNIKPDFSTAGKKK